MPLISLQPCLAVYFHLVSQFVTQARMCSNSHGLVCAGAAFVELYFVLASIFASRAYYAFGFLALTAGNYHIF
jgi:Endomembrane protein 70